MPKYVKDGRVIFASQRAYERLYADAGYLPYREDKKLVQEEDQAPKAPFTPEGGQAAEDQDDYEDDYVEIDENEAMPLVARVNMLSYEDLKAKAKELGIPKYANTKRDELVNLVVAAIEAQNA